MADTHLFGDISPRTAAYVAKRLLERGMYQLITERFAQVKTLPSRSTRTIKFRRYESLPFATTPLSEGVTPPADRLTYSDVQATVEQYGSWMELTDVIMDTHEDPILNEMADLLGEQAPDTLETIRIAVLKAGTSVVYDDEADFSGPRSAVIGHLGQSDSVTMMRVIQRAFKDQKARYYTQILKASTSVATEPIGPGWFAMGHTDLESDLRSNAEFLPVEKYSDSSAALPGEVGKLENVRIILTPLFTPWADAGGTAAGNGGTGGTALMSTTGTSADVYPLIVVSPNAYAVVPLKGKTSVTPKVLNPGVPRGGDPLGQKGSIGWKTYHAAVILNDAWMYRIETGATDLAT